VLLHQDNLLLHQDDLLPCYGIDPRVLNFFDISATVDTSFRVDCSDSGCSSLSCEIFERCSDDSMSTSS
jgi:hypothetical protein